MHCHQMIILISYLEIRLYEKKFNKRLNVDLKKLSEEYQNFMKKGSKKELLKSFGPNYCPIQKSRNAGTPCSIFHKNQKLLSYQQKLYLKKLKSTSFEKT